MRGDTEISNNEDTIDTRQIEERIDFLEDTEDEDEKTELDALLAFREEIQSITREYEHGETLIRDSHFQDYAEQLAEDCDMIPKGLSWPMTCIDWERAANELKYDYSCADFAGVTYWVRL